MSLAIPPTVCGLIAIVMWSSMFLLLALTAPVPPFLLGFASFGIGFLVISAGQYALGQSIVAAFRRPWQDYLYCIGGIGGYTTIIYTASHHAPVFEVSIVNYLWPILLALMVSVFDRAPLTKIQFLGLLMGFCGTVLLFMPPAGVPFFEGIQPGHLIALFGAFLWAAYSTLARTRTYPFGFIGPVLLCSSLLCLALHLVFEEALWPWNAAGWIALVILGLFRISYAFWEYSLKHGDRQLIVSLSNLIPLLANLLLIVGGFGPARLSVALAALFVITGCLLVNHQRLHKLLERFA